jgi:CRP/FNR family cyclic AMP-dependent transcriptional regulator
MGLTKSVFPADLRHRLADLLPAGRLVAFRARDRVFREGEESDHIAIIVRGVVKITASTRSGRQALLGLRGPGEIVGELGVLYGSPRSASVQALDSVTARLISAHDFRRCLADHPHAMFGLLAAVIARLRESDRRRLEFAGFDVPDRVTLLLAELAGTHGTAAANGTVTIGLRISQEEIAEATGASREAVAKALRLLRQRGLVSTARRKIVVLNPGQLRPSAEHV